METQYNYLDNGGIGKSIQDRLDEIKSANDSDLTLLCLCSSYWDITLEKYLKDEIMSAPAVAPVMDAINKGMSFDDLCNDFRGNVIFDQAIAKFRDSDYINFNPQDKQVFFDVLTRDYLERKSRLIFSNEFLSAQTTEQKRLLIKNIEQSLDAANGLEEHQYIKVNITDTFDEVKYIFEINGQPHFKLGKLVCIKGQAKSGKTTFLLCILKAYLGGNWFDIVKKRNDVGKVLYIDTEQDREEIHSFMSMLYKSANLPQIKNDERIDFYAGVELSKKDRRDQLELLLENDSYGLLIIDNIKDLCNDFNNTNATDEVLEFLNRIKARYNICVVVVIHENPSIGQEETKMRGHLGTDLTNATTETWRIYKNNGVHNIELVTARKTPTGNKFAYRWTEDGHIEPETFISEEEKNKILLIKRMKPIFVIEDKDVTQYLKRSSIDVVNYYKENYPECASSGKSDLSKCLNYNILIQQEKRGKYEWNEQNK